VSNQPSNRQAGPAPETDIDGVRPRDHFTATERVNADSGRHQQQQQRGQPQQQPQPHPKTAFRTTFGTTKIINGGPQSIVEPRTTAGRGGACRSKVVTSQVV